MLSHQVRPGHAEVLGCKGTLLHCVAFYTYNCNVCFQGLLRKAFQPQQRLFVLTSISPAVLSLVTVDLKASSSYLPSCLFFFCSVRNSMSYLRPGRGGENRRSVFYTGNSSAEEWELVDAPPKDFPEQKHHPDAHRRTPTPCFLIHPMASV